MTDGTSTFMVDLQDLWALEIPAALLPHLLSNMHDLSSRAPSPKPQTGTEGLWGWLSPTNLTTAKEDAVLVAINAMRHLVGKGRNTSRLIEKISGVIVEVGNSGDGEAYVALLEPKRHVDAAQAIVKAVAKGSWSLPHRLTEHRFPIC